MKLNEIFNESNVKIFAVIDQNGENELNWIIEPLSIELIPDEEGQYFVKALQVFKDKTIDCFIDITTPERIAEIVIKHDTNGKVIIESIYDQENTIIPAIASDCFGDYNLYYANENPQIGIDILKKGLSIATHKNVVAEDLGYIFRDEERIEEAIEAFKISEQNEPSSEYIYLELSRLYNELSQANKQIEYEQKFKDKGGIL